MDEQQIKAIEDALAIAKKHADTGINHNPTKEQCSLCEEFRWCFGCPLDRSLLQQKSNFLFEACTDLTKKPSERNKNFYRFVVKLLAHELKNSTN